MTQTESKLPFWNIDRVIVLVTTVITLAAGIYYAAFPEKAKDLVLAVAQTWSSLALVIFILGEVAFAVFVWKRTRGMVDVQKKLEASESEVKTLQERLAHITENLRLAMDGRDATFGVELEPEKILPDFIAFKRIPDRRWENIRTIQYCHLAYAPFLEHAANGKPRGLAVTLLTEKLLGPKGSFGIEIKHETQTRFWWNAIDGLIEGNCDIVATPLFETFERSKKVRFTAPLFFSNVGLYVNKAMAERSVWQGLSVSKLKEELKTAGDLEFLALPGEISQYLAQKYADPKQIIEQSKGAVFTSLFDQVSTQNRPPCAIFCESFRAHLEPTVQSKQVVNVLPEHKILYPVCFAVRKGDYQLANLINLRLLEFTRSRSMLDFLAESLAEALGDDLKQEAQLSEQERAAKVEMRKKRIMEHFVFELPSAVPSQEGVHV